MMRKHAETVIVGAGIVGCSTAYHLTRMGVRDVVVIDQGPLYKTGGSTSHAPGIVFGTNPSHTMTRMAGYTVRLLDGLEFEGEQCWYPVGSIEVATTPERQQEIWRRYGYTRAFGTEASILSPEEVHEKVPIIDPQVITGGFFRPGDGVSDGWKCAGALALQAIETGGAEFHGHTRTTDFELKDGRIHAVLTDRGRIECDRVLLCTNIWGSVLADRVGVTLPMMASAHHYGITEPLPELADKTRSGAIPPVRHQDRAMYFKQQAGAWWTGSYRHKPHMVSSYDVGRDAYHELFEDEFQVAIDDAEELFPALRQRKYVEKVSGMFVFSVDTYPIMGPAHHVPGFWTAIGIWITHSGGAGKIMAEWMTDGRPEWDVREMNVNRFHAHQKTVSYIRKRSTQNYREVYDIIHPKQQVENPRNLRVSPWHARQRELQAEFFAGPGWEQPQWYGANAHLVQEYGIEPRVGWAARGWSPIEGGEHLAVRDRVGLFDLSAFTKIEVSGRGASGFLQHLAANDVDRRVGRVVYTSLLDDNAGIVADLTITRLAADCFWVLTGGGMGPRDVAWIRSCAPNDGSVHVADLSSQYAVVGLWGPAARSVLEQVTGDDVSNEAFPFYSARSIEIGSIPVRALRVSYVGELGWELYAPTEFGLGMWDVLWEAGTAHGIVAAGGGAFDSLRLEKGYRLWGNELHTEYNPHEAGLAWATRPEKGDFIGRAALLRAGAESPSRKLCCLTYDDEASMALGKEAIVDGDRMLGYVTSATMGYSVGKFILYGYLPTDHAAPGTEVEVLYFDQRFAASVVEEPLYDPGMKKMRC